MSNPQGQSEASAKYKWIGTRPDRPDGADKVTGRARFGADFNLPGQLIGKVLRSPHPHAIIKSIDTRKAEALLGYGNWSRAGSKHVDDQLPLMSKKQMRPVWRERKEIETNLESRKQF